MDITSIIRDLEDDLNRADEEMATRRAVIEDMVTRAENAGRSNLSAAEDAHAEMNFREMSGLRLRLSALRPSSLGLVALRPKWTRKIAPCAILTWLRPVLLDRLTIALCVSARKREPTGPTRTRLESSSLRTYRSFVYGDPLSNERLQHHMHEERIERPNTMVERSSNGVGTAAFSGLVVPQYLIDMVAPAVSAMRPLADAVAVPHNLPPEGMSVNISRITTPSSAALQANQLDTVSLTDMGDTLLTANVQTVAGSQLLSRQAIDRGQGIEDTVMADLVSRMAATLDTTLLYQAVHGLEAVATGNPYVDGTPTAPELYPFMLGSGSQIETTLMGRVGPVFLVMHPRRWNWLCSQVGSSWPFLGGNGVAAQQGGVILSSQYGPNVRGVLSNGYRIVVDANIATTKGGGTEDQIFVMSGNEGVHLWEAPGAPVFIRAEQPSAGKLGVLLVVYEYFAYTAERYAGAAQKITGSGLAAPTGF